MFYLVWDFATVLKFSVCSWKYKVFEANIVLQAPVGQL